MSGLQKKLLMSDPMALIQLSARLEQAERNLANMTTLLTELANRKPGELATGGLPPPPAPPPSPPKLFVPIQVNKKCC